MQIQTAQLRLARKIRNFRYERNLTQTGMANNSNIGVSRRTISRIEAKASDPTFTYDPKLSTLVKLSNGLGMNLGQLIGQLSTATV